SRIAHQRLESMEIAVQLVGKARDIEIGQEVAGLHVPSLPIVGPEFVGHLAVRLQPFTAGLQVADEVVEIHAPRVVPIAICPLAIVGGRSELEPAHFRINRERIDTKTRADRFAVGLAVCDRGGTRDRGAKDVRAEAGAVSAPDRVVEILTERAELRAASKLDSNLPRRNHRLNSKRQRRGDKPVHPHRALVLVPVTERLIEKPGHDLHIIVKENLKISGRQVNSRPGTSKRRADHALEHDPVSRAVQNHRLPIEKERVLRRMMKAVEGAALLVIDKVAAGRPGYSERVRSEVSTNRIAKL